jgi:Flp pilus assembly protein TadB
VELSTQRSNATANKARHQKYIPFKQFPKTGASPELKRYCVFQIETGIQKPMAGTLFVNGLASLNPWLVDCLRIGMTLSLIVLALQIVVTVIALVRESGEDDRFEGDKLIYRS